jgi:hypothetical protein
MPSPGSATPDEAAAIAAAIDRFLQDTTVPAPVDGQTQDLWTRAAMLEGVSRDHVDAPHPWITG